MSGAALKIPYRLSWSIAGLMALTSAAGLLFPSVYRDLAWIEATWVGSDLVTLVVAVPLLAGGLLLAGRGSRMGELLVLAMLGFSVYGYAYYLFGAALNALLPAYSLLVSLPAIALMISLGGADVSAMAADFHEKTPVRLVGGYLVFTGVGLSSAWLAQWAAYVFGGQVPSIGAEPFGLVAGMDLTFIVPFMALGGALLWKRSPWGYVIGSMMAIKGMTYTLSLTASSVVSAARAVEGAAAQVPIWGIWTLVGAAMVWLLLRGVARKTR
ncbi:MAG: hypothetical protein ACYC77_03490 [Coriobacteriia bacterium]